MNYKFPLTVIAVGAVISLIGWFTLMPVLVIGVVIVLAGLYLLFTPQ